MTQRFRVFIAGPEDPSLVPRTNTGRLRNPLWVSLFRDTYVLFLFRRKGISHLTFLLSS